MDQNQESYKAEWAKDSEVIKTSIPMYMLFFLIKCMPKFMSPIIARMVAGSFYIFSKSVRDKCNNFQKQLIEYSQGKYLKKPSAYNQILSFSITVLEKVECWIKNVNRRRMHFQNDDVQDLIDTVNGGQGAFIFISHLGNSEILRHFSSINDIALKRDIPVAVLMDLDSTSNFTQTLKKFNPDFIKNIVNVRDITPATMMHLEDVIAQGGLVVSAGDRISKTVSNRFIECDFLGKKAPWSYGVFLLAMLLKSPVYYMFGLRKKALSFNREYDLYVTKSNVNLECGRRERDSRIVELCKEFVQNLEKMCIENPFQWFNFYDFWKIPE